MKNPLRYQMSEYDCGPTCMLNAVSFLFQREDIPPEVIRNIMLYSLDCYGEGGAPGRSGTSRKAMMFLSHWLDGFGKVGHLPVSSQYLSGRTVHIGNESLINDCLRRGGVAVVRLYYEVEHYVLMTGEQEDCLLLFDPWYMEEPFDEKDVLVTLEHPFTYNRVVPCSYFNQEGTGLYALGSLEEREAVLLFNERTKLTEDSTIEYFI